MTIIPTRWPAIVLGLTLALASLGCQSPPQATAPAASAPLSNEGGLTVPSDARVSRFGAALQEPAGIALGPDGAVYVTEQSAAGAGRVVRLVDADGDGQAERVEPLAVGLAAPRGLAWLTPLGQTPVLLVATYQGLTIVEAGQARLVGRLGSDAGRANDVVVGSDGRVYVTEGAAGEDAPPPSAVWRFDPAELLAADNPAQGELFVSGLRSAGGVAFSPSGAIYVTDSGEGWPFRADVPDELNVLLGGGDYGWPRVWGQPPPDSGSIGPMALFPAGSDAAGLVFYTGRMFDEAATDLLVALPGQGKIVRVEIVSDAAGYHSVVHDFVGGLQRPVALAEGPRGELYIADAAAGAVYRLWR
ncbi:MAG TPA: PQQ-dependent sugar dehydrogenase [Anaerolineae bacterium]|nr:PQQ-dependent sugar dehydrogenase [Anaerolineae bacterium]